MAGIPLQEIPHPRVFPDDATMIFPKMPQARWKTDDSLRRLPTLAKQFGGHLAS
jgi:hypothetical protein